MAAERFLADFRGLVAQTKLLHSWSAGRLTRKLDALGLPDGEDVPLGEYLEELCKPDSPAPCNRTEACLAMLDHFGVARRAATTHVPCRLPHFEECGLSGS